MLKINSDGYIYHLLKNYSGYSAYRTTDLCSVMRSLVLSVFFICVIIACSVGAGVTLFAWVIPFMAFGFDAILLSDRLFVQSFAAMLIILIFVVSVLIANGFSKIKQRWNGTVEPSVLSVWYKGFKDKYCPLVEFVDKDESV